MEREALWQRVVDAKYGSSQGGWCSDVVPGSYRVSMWKNIPRELPSYSKLLTFEVGGMGLRCNFGMIVGVVLCV